MIALIYFHYTLGKDTFFPESYTRPGVRKPRDLRKLSTSKNSALHSLTNAAARRTQAGAQEDEAGEGALGGYVVRDRVEDGRDADLRLGFRFAIVLGGNDAG